MSHVFQRFYVFYFFVTFYVFNVSIIIWTILHLWRTGLLGKVAHLDPT